MTSNTLNSVFWSGFRDGSPFILVAVPFALLFGVISIDAGLDLVETMTMSALVVAGAAQFTAISLMLDHAPTFIVLLTALAVNLRLAMYSAALVPHLGKTPFWLRALMAYFMVDQAFAVAFKKFEEQPAMSQAHKIAYYFGCLTPIVPLWYVFSYVGAVAGQKIPAELSLDFAIPICFIALTAPMMRSLPHFVAALVSVAATLALIWVPYNLGLIIAAILAMIAGAQVELWLKRRAGA
ncbi:MAG: AzlC family ABC transporter permease [Proteobacteria bacterium]|nr:AzlC family ABC transporter permease [Pseudomonadota bacterium]MDA1287439.1 AzlC family ABC transporter permease [Pseudomonadota bacterium]